jgi:hypothetical protein
MLSGQATNTNFIVDRPLLVLWVISQSMGNWLQMLVRPTTCKSIGMSDNFLWFLNKNDA